MLNDLNIHGTTLLSFLAQSYASSDLGGRLLLLGAAVTLAFVGLLVIELLARWIALYPLLWAADNVVGYTTKRWPSFCNRLREQPYFATRIGQLLQPAIRILLLPLALMASLVGIIFRKSRDTYDKWCKRRLERRASKARRRARTEVVRLLNEMPAKSDENRDDVELLTLSEVANQVLAKIPVAYYDMQIADLRSYFQEFVTDNMVKLETRIEFKPGSYIQDFSIFVKTKDCVFEKTLKTETGRTVSHEAWREFYPSAE